MITAPADYRLHASLCYQLTVTSRLQERRLEERLRELGLSRVSWCILLAVDAERLSRPSDIAEFVGIDRTATSRALRQMEASGLIARESGTQDRRTTSVRATDKGRALMQSAVPHARENNGHFCGKLGPDEVAQLHDLLARLREGEERSITNF